MQIPLVSIGMPLYNEEVFLKEALDSLLAQDYPNFEILLSDNASTDQTQEICDEYMKRDQRISCIRHQENVGAHRNFSDLVPRAKGKYFFFAAGHDLWDPSFVRECVSVLESDPEVVIAYPKTKLIAYDGSDREIAPFRIDTRSLPPPLRYKKFLWHTDCNIVYGVMRRNALLQTGVFQDIWGPDQLLLSEMAFLGTFAQVNKPLWMRRQNRPPETLEQKKKRTIHDINPKNSGKRQAQSLRAHYTALRNAHIAMLHRQHLSFLSRWWLIGHTILAFAVRNDALPGAHSIKRCVHALLPTQMKRKIIRWLRVG